MKRLQQITISLGIVFIIAPAVLAGNIGGLRTQRTGNIGGLRSDSEQTIKGNIGGLRSDITAELQGNIAGLLIQMY